MLFPKDFVPDISLRTRMTQQLFQYVIATEKTNINGETDFLAANVNKKTLTTWNNHAHLHLWMTNLYRKKNGKFEEFSLTTLLLKYQDIINLKEFIDNNYAILDHPFKLQHVSKEQNKKDIDFVGTAMCEIMANKDVYYVAWW